MLEKTAGIPVVTCDLVGWGFTDLTPWSVFALLYQCLDAAVLIVAYFNAVHQRIHTWKQTYTLSYHGLHQYYTSD